MIAINRLLQRKKLQEYLNASYDQYQEGMLLKTEDKHDLRDVNKFFSYEQMVIQHYRIQRLEAIIKSHDMEMTNLNEKASINTIIESEDP